MITDLLNLLDLLLYIPGIWVCAYVLRMTAPQQCTDPGVDYAECKVTHMFHVKRNEVGYDVALALFWPLLLLIGAGALFVRSVEGAAEITPTPKFMVPDHHKMLEAADKEVEDFKEELNTLREEQLNRRYEEKKNRKGATDGPPPIEGVVVSRYRGPGGKGRV